jgi:cysteine desulfurase/selenocysteine lyase
MNKAAIRRELFPVTDHLIYLNHAAVGPLSERACRAMEGFAREQRDFGALHWRDWLEEYVGFREAAARLIGAKKSEISILKNTTEGLSFVAEGIGWKSGENVVTTDSEFPSNFAPWKRLERRGVECRVVAAANGFTVADLEPLVDARTRVVAISSVAFHDGFTADLEAIGTFCRDRGVLLCVDAIQSVGVLRTDVRRCNISFLAADAHKWMLGPEGTAIFYCAEELRESLEVFESGWMNIKRGPRFISPEVTLLEDGRRFEAGSLNTAGIYAATAAIELLNEIGIEEIEREVLRLANRLADGLASIGFEIRTQRPCRSGIVGAVPQNVSLERLNTAPVSYKGPDALLYAIHAHLEQERIVCSPREAMLRFSPHFYNSDEEIDTVIETLGDLRR